MGGFRAHRQSRAVIWGALALTLCPLAGVSAANHYVDNDASGSNNGTSWTHAWQSFAAINWASVAPGDTIYISGGASSKIYNETLTVSASGTASQPIVITKGGDAGHDGTVIIDGQWALTTGVWLDEDDYVTVRGLEVRDVDGRMIRVQDATGVVVEDNVLHIIGKPGVHIYRSAEIVVRRNRMTTERDNPIGQTDGIFSQLSRDNLFEHNHIVISNNDSYYHSDGIQVNQDTNLTARFNYIEQDNTKVSNAQGIFVTQSYGTIIAYGNVVYGPNTKNGLLTLLHLDIGDAHMLAYNNTIVGSGWGGISIDTTASGSVVKNNILVCYQTAGLAIRVTSDIDPADIDYNLYYAPNSSSPAQVDFSTQTWSEWQALGYEAHGQLVDPLLVSVGSRNFRLQATSAAIDAGTPLGATYAVDADGTSRPQGDGWDQGAYELGDGTPPVDWIFREDFESGDTTAWSAVFPEPPPGLSKLVPVGVTASDYEVPNAPENTLDGDLGTRWSSLGIGQWIRYDLGSAMSVEEVRVAFFIGDQRTASFEIEVSLNDSTWSSVFTGDSNGTTLQLQPFSFAATQARYVRYMGYGNSNDGWNSLTEVEIYGRP
jgi:hypothetical protein